MSNAQTMPVSSCRICGAKLEQCSNVLRDPALTRCDSCKTAQLSFRVDEQEELYQPFHQESGIVHKLIDTALNVFYLERISTMRRAGVKIARDSNRQILDVGCGSGAFLNSVKSYFKLCGVEPFSVNESLFSDIQDKIHRGTLEDLDVVDASFDVITFWHSLEHLHDPGVVLKKAASLLKDDGVIYISVPNFNSLQAKLFGKNWFHLVIPRHTLHFEKQTLDALLSRCGFETRFVGTFAMEYGLSGWVQSLLNAMFEKDLFYEWVKARGDYEASSAPGKTLKVIFSLIVAVLFLPLAVVFEALAGLVGQGAVLNVMAVKKRELDV